ncbi:hypothetical protein L1987_08432 [Smallanthus sonchifolius]|uniref:Uncharacterized protein n=1 Tax=Smallanthus sonchifolius TaxID=185202 RepID=A0ACB9JKL3_9ASTR|nr:hypothetical protein L1987_08432 [Smallanthus sonchifolius]
MAAFFVSTLIFFSMAAQSSATWCVCKKGGADKVLQQAIDYACGNGADCTQTHQGGKCFNPDTIFDHCNYAVNSYFQNKRQAPGSCDFSGAAMVVTTDPSSNGCVFPTSASGTSGTTNTRSPGSSFGNNGGPNTLRAHAMEVSPGCDIGESLATFARRKQQGIWVLSATGFVSNVMLRQPSLSSVGPGSGPVVTLHGRFEILSLVGSVLPPPGVTGLAIYLVGPQGQVVGGAIAGPLMAFGPVVIMAATFMNATFDRLPVDKDDAIVAATTTHDQLHHRAMGVSDIYAPPQNLISNNSLPPPEIHTWSMARPLLPVDKDDAIVAATTTHDQLHHRAMGVSDIYAPPQNLISNNSLPPPEIHTWSMARPLSKA